MTRGDGLSDVSPGFLCNMGIKPPSVCEERTNPESRVFRQLKKERLVDLLFIQNQKKRKIAIDFQSKICIIISRNTETVFYRKG